MTAPTIRAVVRCACGLNQFDKLRCRRCRQPLHPVEAAAKALTAALRVQMRKPIRWPRREVVSDVSRALGRIVRRHREPLMSLRSFSERIGCSANMLSMIETGRANASLRLTEALARALDLTASELLHQAELEVPAMIAAQTVRFGPQRVSTAEREERTA